jgi:excisionase family DNA binding protein
MQPLLDIKTAARLLGVAPSTLYDWCAHRQIPYLKVGRRTLFDPEELQRWLEQRRVRATP